MSKHTPGPWIKRGKFTSDTIETMGKMSIIRDSFGGMIGAFDTPEDAVLAAAGPDMLALLKLISARLELEEREHPGEGYMFAAYRQEIAALVKTVEGE